MFFAEVAGVEQNFCALAVKLFENNGYKYTNSAGSGNSNGSVLSGNGAPGTTSTSANKGGSIVADANETARELISEFESPMTRVGWDSMIRAGMNNRHIHTFNIFTSLSGY